MSPALTFHPLFASLWLLHGASFFLPFLPASRPWPAYIVHLFTMKITRSLGLLNILLLAGSVRAIEVVADSGCASSCIDSGSRGNVSDPRASSTQHDDLFCLDAHYSGGSEQTTKALYWQGCLSCEASSPSYAPGIHNDTENDVQMFLCKTPFC